MQQSSPGISYLDGTRLNRCLCAGIDKLLNGQDHLNKINVFPVADGDTGTNLAATAGAIGVCITNLDTAHAGELLIEVADAALDGARGNSGAILAQFFQGLADSCETRPRLLPADLAASFRAGAEYARSAVTEPKPGTILTVIDAVADELDTLHRQNPDQDFAMLFTGTLELAHAALDRTQQQLDVLRRAGVVDAGAKGFVLLLEGIGEFLSSGSIRAVPTPLVNESEVNVLNSLNASETDLDFRYCTECLILGDNIDQRKLRERLSAQGNSMIVAGTPRKTKVHIHVDEPAEVFRICGEYGELKGRKADDMRQQAHAVGTGSERYAVITDSAADLPDAAMEIYDIHVVPLRVQFGDKSYLDGVGMTPAEFFAELGSNPVLPKTSQPAPGDYRRMFDFLTSHFEHVFCITLASELSGTWQAATTAAERSRKPDAITVIDSRSVSLAQGMVALHAAECIAAGASQAETAAAAAQMAAEIHGFGLVRDLSHAVRGGRVRPIVHQLARLTGIHPIIHAFGDGTVKPGGFVFGGKQTLARFIRHIGKYVQQDARYRLGIAHAANESEAIAVRDQLRDTFANIDDCYITELGTALGVHTGPGALAVAVQKLRPSETSVRADNA